MTGHSNGASAALAAAALGIGDDGRRIAACVPVAPGEAGIVYWLMETDERGNGVFNAGFSGPPLAEGFEQVEHGDDEDASMKCHGLARFQIHFDIVALTEAFDHADEFFQIITRTGDVMAATEVEPFKTWNEIGEFRLKGLRGMLQCIGVLFAKCMEVETIDLLK